MTKNRGKYGWWDVLSIPKADFAKLKRLLPASPAKGVKVRKSPDSSSSTKKLARLYFGRLDKDKDGKLSAKEWEMAGRVRVLFEKQKIELAIPADVDKFAKAFAASRR